MKETYQNLWACHLAPEFHERTCNYWYTVTADGCMAHTAFETRAGLDRWLGERGLTLAGNIDDEGTSCRINGAYRKRAYLSDAADFWKLTGTLTRVMDNADWTLGVITTDPDGLRTVHYLNPNVHDRPVFDYHATSALMR